MTGKSISRSCEDLDETVLSASEVKAVATENPLLAEKMTIDNEVTRLQLLRSRWDSQRSKLDNDIRITYPNKLGKLTNELSNYTKDLAVLSSNPEEPFSITIKGQVFEERKAAFEEINAIAQLAPSGVETDCGEYRGLNVRVQRNDYVDDRLILSGNSDYVTTFTPQTGIGNIARLIHLLTRVEELVDLTTKEIAETEKHIQQAKLEVEKPFSKQEELNEKIARQRQVTKQIELDTLRQAPKIIKQAEKSI